MEYQIETDGRVFRVIVEEKRFWRKNLKRCLFGSALFPLGTSAAHFIYKTEEEAETAARRAFGAMRERVLTWRIC